MLIALFGLLAYLTYIPVPAANRELIVTLFAVLLGAGASAVPNLFGEDKTETTQLRKEVDELKSQLEVMAGKYAENKTAYDKIVEMLIVRHVVTGQGIDLDDA
jgi:ABC-type Na+ efflux pump permease subunit